MYFLILNWKGVFLKLFLLFQYSLADKLEIKENSICGTTKELNLENKISFKLSENDRSCRVRLLFNNRCTMGVSCTGMSGIASSRNFKFDTPSSSGFGSVIEIKDEKGNITKLFGSNESKNIFEITGGEAELTFRTKRTPRQATAVNNPILNALGMNFQTCTLLCTNHDTQSNIRQEDLSYKPLGKKSKINCRCGDNSGTMQTKIVNGVEARIGEFPWHVGLLGRNRRRPYCGGTLINSQYVMTAAHCVTLPNIKAEDLEIVLNEHNLLINDEINSTRIRVSSIIVHPSYRSGGNVNSNNNNIQRPGRPGRLFFGALSGLGLNAPTPNDYDAALLRLREPVDINSQPPVCLPRGENLRKTYAGSSVTVSGWGRTSETGDPSTVLLKTNVRVLSNNDCARRYVLPNLISQRMVCATGQNSDACFGDSGGSLVLNENGAYSQIGVVSWGFGCNRNFPGVYARVSEFMPWIIQSTQDAVYCTSS